MKKKKPKTPYTIINGKIYTPNMLYSMKYNDFIKLSKEKEKENEQEGNLQTNA